MSSPRTSNLPPPRPLTVSSTNHSSMPSLPPPSFRSVTAPKRVASFSLKVVKATMCRQGKRKAEFQPISQTYLELVESTANLEHILSIIQKRWGTEYTLVTSDGLPLEDSPATQGLLLPKQMFCVLSTFTLSKCISHNSSYFMLPLLSLLYRTVVLEMPT